MPQSHFSKLVVEQLVRELDNYVVDDCHCNFLSERRSSACASSLRASAAKAQPAAPVTNVGNPVQDALGRGVKETGR